MGHNRRIEQGGGLQRVFAGEERPNQELTYARERALGKDVRMHFGKVRQQGHINIIVPRIKFGMNGRHLLLDLFLGEGQSAPNDGGDALEIIGNEGADDDPCAVWQQHDLVTAKGEITHV